MSLTSSDTYHKAAPAGHALSPWPIRLLVYLMLILIALASIWLIDRRAMPRLAQLQGQSPIEAKQP